MRRALWQDPSARWLLLTAGVGMMILSMLSTHRADRLFPLLPLLSLLLVETVRVSLQDGPAHGRFSRWRRWTACFGVLGTAIWLGYAATQCLAAYARGDDGLIAFGREARALVDRNGWRIEVAHDVALHTGMVIYAGLDHRQVASFEQLTARRADPRSDAVVIFAVREAEARIRGWEPVLRSHSGRPHPEQCVLLRPRDATAE